MRKNSRTAQGAPSAASVLSPWCWRSPLLTALLALGLLSAPLAASASPQAPVRLAVLGQAGAVTALTDGNLLRLRARLDQAARRAVEVTFALDATHVGHCTIPARARQCETAPFAALGWYWSEQGEARPTRTLTATTTGARAAMELRIAPRPVMLLHGFMASAKKWTHYTQPDGFLAALTLKGFAVGDGQVEGVLQMGDLANPKAPTRTVPENAAVLQRTVAAVKQATGAEMVDLVAHSMGGLVARYYIARLMPRRDVAQLLMLGTPNGGSDCAALPSALGIFMPSALELRPAHLEQVFNRSITQRQGVPFFLLAGDPIVDGFKAPCTSVPSDLIVPLQSVAAVAGPVLRMPRLHIQMNGSPEVFEQFVAPHLRSPAGQFPRGDDAPQGAVAAERAGTPTQFIQILQGQVPAGGSSALDIQLDQVAVASFALFDPTRALSVTVRGASGKVIELTPQDHGLIKVDDPDSIVQLGYGFNRPKPGPWRVTLHNPAQSSADYALSVRVVGGAQLHAHASSVSPTLRDTVRLSATLDLPGKPLTDVRMQAVVHGPGGSLERLALQGSGTEYSVDWKPTQRGLHGVDIVASAQSDALRIERTTLIALEVRP